MEITLHAPDTPRHVPSWLLLAGAAGTVNGFAFLLCEPFVSHVTGPAPSTASAGGDEALGSPPRPLHGVKASP